MHKRTVRLLAAVLLFFFLFPARQIQAREPVVVVIDPGHGGDENRGGEVASRFVEKDLTLQTAMAMKQTLEQFEGVTVILTRSTDQALSLEERAAFAEACQADFLVSLHYNMSSEHNLYGSEVWTSAFGDCFSAGQTFGRLQLAEMSQYNQFIKGVKTRLNSRGTDYYGVIRAATARGIPCVIVEHCYMDHGMDSPHIDTAQKVSNMGISDAIAMAKYFHLKSASLGLDYTDYAFTTVSAPAGGVCIPDSTPPEQVALTVTGAGLNTGKVELSLTAKDPQSGLLYYSYSLDGGLSWSGLMPWAWAQKTGADTVTFSVTVPGGSSPLILCRAYNGYDSFTVSNAVAPGVFAAR